MLNRCIQTRLIDRISSAFQWPSARVTYPSSRRTPLAEGCCTPVDEKSDWAAEFVAESVEHRKFSIHNAAMDMPVRDSAEGRAQNIAFDASPTPQTQAFFPELVVQHVIPVALAG